jgi:hypothetical protein
MRRRARFALELVRAFYWLIRVERGLRRSDLPAVCRTLGIACDLASAAPPATERAVLPRGTRTPVHAGQYAVAHWPPGDTCLRRCLVLGRRLRHLGPVLRIGVRRDSSGGFVAHSWLEIDGRTLDPESARYATLGTV